MRQEYDAAGRLSSRTLNYVDGDPTTGTADSDLVARVAFDPVDRPITSTVNYVDGVWDPAHPDQDRSQVTRYDTAGRVSEVIQNYVDGTSSSGEPDTDLVTHYTYDAVGNLVAASDHLGRVTVLAYDGLNRPIELVRNCTDGSGTPVTSGCDTGHGPDNDRNISSSITYTARGQVESGTDAIGRVNELTYDALGRAVGQVNNVGGAVTPANVSTQWMYTLVSGVGYTRTMTNALGYASTWQYDVNGELAATTDATNRATQLAYDGLGRMSVRTDALSHETRYLYDPTGRMSKVVANWQNGVVDMGDGPEEDLTTQYAYDAAGRTTAITGPDGKTIAYAYSGLNYLTTSTENSGGAVAPSDVATQYEYDRLGQLLSVSDPLNHTRHRAYDGLGQMVSETDALTRTTTYAYDRAGNLLTRIDPRVITVTYGYDSLDRLLSTSASSGLSTPITWAYNAASQPITLTDETGTTVFAYDGADALLTSAHSVDGTVTYGRDDLGRPTTLSTSTGAPSVGYSYDQAGRLAAVTRGGSPHASATYDAIGRLSTLSYAVGVTTTLSYDNADRLTRLLTQDSGSATKTDFQYTLDRGGQVASASDTITSTTRTTGYTYDGLSRLIGASESPGTVFTYTYDLAGNRTQVQENASTIQSLAYDAANQVSTSGWSYDGAGNLLTDGTSTYTYNALRQMTSTARGGSTYSYLYSGMGIAASQSLGGVQTRYTLDLSGPLPERLGATTSGASTWFIRGWGRELSRESGGTISAWYQGDRLGSVRATLDTGGSVSAGYWYDPYGTPEGIGSAPTDYGFTGEPQNAATGLVDLRARWYPTELGRFNSQDRFAGSPLVPASLQPYSYVYNDPLNYRDPSGNTPEDGDVNYHACVEGDLEACKKEFWAYRIEIETDNGGDWGDHRLRWILEGIRAMIAAAGWSTFDFQQAMGEIKTNLVGREFKRRVIFKLAKEDAGDQKEAAHTKENPITGDHIVTFYGSAFSRIAETNCNPAYQAGLTAVHELGHVWDHEKNKRLSDSFKRVTKGSTQFDIWNWRKEIYKPGNGASGDDKDGPLSDNSRGGVEEDFAESVAATVYPQLAQFNVSGPINPDSIRLAFVRQQYTALSEHNQQLGR